VKQLSHNEDEVSQGFSWIV